MIPDNVVHFANHLWQSTLFAGAVWLITLALRENRAAVRHALWFVASAKFLIPFSLLTAIGKQFHWLASVSPAPRVSFLMGTFSQPFGTPDVAIPIGATSPVAPSGLLLSVLPYVWIFGFATSLLWWTNQWFQLSRAVRQATPLNLNVPIRVLAHHGQLEPGVFGIFRPVLLLPMGITGRLSPEQLQAVLAHELCHVRRRDNLTAAIHMFVETLFWFHPLVWWIKLRLIDEQERACDEEVLRLGGNPQVYAESILKVCECYLTSPSMCVSGITSSNLKKRIEEIMKNRVVPKLSLSKGALLAIATIAALVGPIVAGSIKPGVAQPAPVTVSRAATPQAGLRGGASGSVAIEGYRVGEIRIVGVKEFNGDTIRSVLGLVPGAIYDESQVRDGFRDLMKLYGNLGYVNFLPQPEFGLDEQRKVVNLTINIDEGPQYKVHHVSFVGNTTTPDDVLRREFLAKEGAVFSASLLEQSLSKLNQLGLFEQINIEDARIVPSPGESKLDVSLKVTEKTR